MHFTLKLTKSSVMLLKAHLLLLIFLIRLAASDGTTDGYGFTFNGNLKLDGLAEVTSNGIFKLTDATPFGIGHAFYSSPLSFKNLSTGKTQCQKNPEI